MLEAKDLPSNNLSQLLEARINSALEQDRQQRAMMQVRVCIALLPVMRYTQSLSPQAGCTKVNPASQPACLPSEALVASGCSPPLWVCVG